MVLVAAFIVKSLPLDILRRGVVAVVTYTGAVMLRAALARSHLHGDRHGDPGAVYHCPRCSGLVAVRATERQ